MAFSKMAINGFPREKSFENIQRNDSFIKITIKIILYNFILQEIIKCDNGDPPWIGNSIRCLI